MNEHQLSHHMDYESVEDSVIWTCPICGECVKIDEKGVVFLNNGSVPVTHYGSHGDAHVYLPVGTK